MTPPIRPTLARASPPPASEIRSREASGALTLDRSEPHAPNLFTNLTVVTSGVAPARVDPIDVPEALRSSFDVFVRAGMSETDALRLVVRGANEEEAVAITNRLLSVPVSFSTFGPRATAVSVLAGVVQSGGVDAEEIRASIRAHVQMAIVRPDGYLVCPISGLAYDRVGDVRIDEGRLVAGPLEVGRFYARRGGIIRDLDGDRVLYESPIEHGLGGKFLDGAEEAMTEMILGLGRLIEEPIRIVEDLAHLPFALGDLVRHSPDLLEQLIAMPPGDQARLLGQITTTLLSMTLAAGSAASAVQNGGKAGGLLPVLNGERLALQWQLSLSGPLAGVAAPSGAVLLVPGPVHQLTEALELSSTTQAALKRAGRRLSKEGAKLAKIELRKLAAERMRILDLLDALSREPRLSANSRARIRSARRALENNLKPEEMVGALRDELGIPVRRAGDGHVYDHLQEASEALESIERSRRAVAKETVRLEAGGEDIAGLSKSLDAISSFLARVRAFLEIR